MNDNTNMINQNVAPMQLNEIPNANTETLTPVTDANQIVNDVSIKVTEVGPEGKKQIIVNGQDITNLPVDQLSEELADAMTEEQAAEYIKGFTEEQIETFREVYGFIITAPKMSEAELSKRSENRATLAGELSSTTSEGTQETQNQPTEQKKEQTGSIIFGARN